MEQLRDPKILGGAIGAGVLVLILLICTIVFASKSGGLQHQLDEAKKQNDDLSAQLATSKQAADSADILTKKAREERDKEAAARKQAEDQLAEEKKARKAAEAAADESEKKADRARRDAEKSEADRAKAAADRDHQVEAWGRLRDENEALRKDNLQLKQQLTQVEPAKK